jgi:hypothetical protein
VPRSRINEDTDAQRFLKLRPGDAVALVVESVRPEEHRLTLAPPASAQRDDWRQHQANENSATLGTLADKLQQAMAGRKPKDR